MRTHRIVRVSGPHFKDYWVVEKARRTWFGRIKWKVAREFRFSAFGDPVRIELTFDSQEDADAWVTEDMKPYVREVCLECGPAA